MVLGFTVEIIELNYVWKMAYNTGNNFASKEYYKGHPLFITGIDHFLKKSILGFQNGLLPYT